MSTVDPTNDVTEAAGVYFVPVGLIDMDERGRLRPINDIWAQALGEMIRREGQSTPVDLVRVKGGGFRLAGAGGHRLRAHQLHDFPHIKAFIHPDNADQAKLREIRDNLHRLDLDPYDRAAFIAEAVAVKKRLVGIDPDKDGRTASAQARWQKALKSEAEDAKDTMSIAYGWNDAVAEELGFSSKLIQRDLLLFRRLAPSVVELLREQRHPILKNAAQLRQLAKLDHAEQERVASRMIDHGYGNAAKSVSDALQLVRGTNRPAGDPRAKRFATIIGTLSRMDARERLGLFQSPDFHALLPTEAQKLLAPMRRGSGAIDQ